MATRDASSQDPAEGASFVRSFTPKLVTVLREGYDFGALRADVLAGLTVAIVALPLSMAIAVASGVTPDRGLHTAIVGGLLISAFSGSRHQVGGPAGAFIVLVAATVDQHGVDGLILATILAGAMLAVGGFLRLGGYVKFIPYPVTVGFSAAIATIIFASQIKELFGLTLPGKEPGPLAPKLEALWAAAPTVNWSAVATAGLCVAVIVALKRFRPGWPGMLIGIVAACVMVASLDLPVETIGSRFGGVPQTPPSPTLPDISIAKILAVLPNAFGFALLGAIESLLSAVVADGMTGRRHRSNCELVAQGIGNIGSGLFGGFCVTGAIARTATNIRAGARGPIAGICHALFLLVFMLAAAPLARFIPLPALAGALAVVAWGMAEKEELVTLLRSSRGDALVLVATFALTIFRDLTEGIVVGVALGALLFIHRMSQTAGVEAILPPAPDDDAAEEDHAAPADDPSLRVYRITGPFFFGTAALADTILDRLPEPGAALAIDFAAVPFIDSTAADTVAKVVRRARRHGVDVYVTGASASVRRTLLLHGLRESGARFRVTPQNVVEERRDHRQPESPPAGA